VIDKTEFDPRIARLRERIRQLEAHVQQIQDQESLEQELQMIIGHLETFATKVNQGLHAADWLTRREIIRTLVKRVEIDQEKVNVVFRIGPNTPPSPSDHHTQSLQHCGGRENASLWSTLFCCMKDVFIDEPRLEPFSQNGLFHRNML
jgi:site-specific DNA recombinase